ncbi:MAG: HAD hydrolase-like protein [Saprospirales bacterium]|nr:HAD hydrolase-like protein [Saprospirales bacterium]MBK8491954.1 HAD hydrolase-like protein [Saprospirales bacterium]
MKGVIFDLDGTMVDNMNTHHRAWQKKLASLNLDWDLETVKREVHGVNEEIIERIFGDRFSPEERCRISAEKELEYRTIFRDHLQLVAGLPGLLEELSAAHIPMAVGTAAPIENVDFVLDHLGIRHYFRAVLHAGNVSKRPPTIRMSSWGLPMWLGLFPIFRN